MSGFTYSIQFNTLGSGSLSRTLAVLDQLDGEVDNLNVSVHRLGGNLQRAGKQGAAGFGAMSSGLGGLVAQLGVVAGLTKSVQDGMRMEGLEASTAFAVGGEEAGAKALAYVREESDRLGLSYMSSLAAYKNFAGAVKGTALESSMNDIFTAVNEGATVMKLTEYETEGVMYAISQMASKGIVSAEELRQQLGERLPGAIGLASKAMGMSQAEFNKQLESGKITAQEFLPKLAAIMRETYADGIPAAINSSQANFNRFKNTLTDISVIVGERLLPPFINFLHQYAIPALKWIGENIDIFMALGSAILGAAATVKVATAATWLFNASLLANPIGLVVVALGAVAGAVVWAWNRFEKFRGFIVGFFGYLKENVKLFFEIFVEPLKNIGKMLIGIFTLDKNLIMEGIQGNMDVWKNSVLKAGTRLGSAFTTGYQKGVGAKATGTPSSSTQSAGGAVDRQFAGNAGAKAADSNLKKGINDITGGGKSAKNITINLGKLVEQLIVKTERMTESGPQIRDLVQRELLQVLNTANQIQ